MAVGSDRIVSERNRLGGGQTGMSIGLGEVRPEWQSAWRRSHRNGNGLGGGQIGMAIGSEEVKSERNRLGGGQVGMAIGL